MPCFFLLPILLIVAPFLSILAAYQASSHQLPSESDSASPKAGYHKGYYHSRLGSG